MTRSIFMSKVDKGCKGYSQFWEITRMVTEFQEPEKACLMMIVVQTIKDGLG